MEYDKKSGLFLPEGLKGHHSLTDWDFNPSIPYVLDSTVYVSAPSSLRLTQINAGGTAKYPGPLCRDDSCLNLPEGRVETQWRTTSFTVIALVITFRNQGGLGTIDPDNTYLIYLSASGTMSARKRVAGVETVLGTWARAHVGNTWYQERCTWWNEAPALLIRYEYWDGSAWVVVGVDIQDNTPDFGDSETNRCGLGIWNVQGTAAAKLYYDDTSIYGPA